VRIFKFPWFTRFASKEGMQDSDLIETVNSVLSKGLADADLGAGVYKVRIARPGEGKSGGYRVIVFFKSRKLTFFAYGFAKSARANISEGELYAMKKLAKKYLAQTEEQIEMHLANGTLLEITEGVRHGM